MALLRIPYSLREHTDGLAAIEVAGDDVPSALEELARRYPHCAERVLDESGRTRPWVRILRDGRELSIMPSVAGG